MNTEQKINTVIRLLTAEISEVERAEGWTVESKAAARKFFEELRSKVQGNERLPLLSIPRWLDHLGVSNGIVFEMSAEISNELSA